MQDDAVLDGNGALHLESLMKTVGECYSDAAG